MTVEVGQLLTATAASVTGRPTPTRTWQWLRDGTAISGATASTYTAAEADLDALLSVQQIETNAFGVATAVSATVGPVIPVPPFDPTSLADLVVWAEAAPFTAAPDRLLAIINPEAMNAIRLAGVEPVPSDI